MTKSADQAPEVPDNADTSAAGDDATEDDLTGAGPLDAASTRRLRQEAMRRRVENRELRGQLDAVAAREARRDRADVLALAREVGYVDPEDALTLKVVSLDALPRTEEGDVDADALRETLTAVKRTRGYLFDGFRPAPLPGQGARGGSEVFSAPAGPSWDGLLKPAGR